MFSNQHSINSRPSGGLLLALSLLLLALLLGACSGAASDQPAGVQRFTGFLENEEVTLASETGGRILEISVQEGDQVSAGQVVARLDDEGIRLSLAQADADVAEAEAKLAQLKAAVRPEDVALAEARLEQAQAGLEAAESALQDAIRLRDNPQELDVQIAQAQATLAEARAHAEAAEHQARSADIEAQMWGEIARDLAQGKTVTLPDGSTRTVTAPPDQRYKANLQWNIASQKAWKAWQQAAEAKSAAAQALVALNTLREQRKNQQEAEARVVEATNARDNAKAAVAQAQAALDAVKAGPSEEQIAAAEAAVQQARAVRDARAVQLEKTVIKTPIDGVVTARYFSQGEVAGPGQRLVAISQPDQVTITIYAPASLIDSIQVDDIYALEVESAPGQQYQARVTGISDEPEFTMRQSQNVAERAAVVYAITLQIENPDDLLRPGLPADVLIPVEDMQP
jgi:HlyD family secretion protein